MSASLRSANDIRADFIEFFQSKQHKFVPSSPVVPHDDPSLLFANAGMNQFKPIFLNTLHVNSPLNGVSRACNSQKCIRAGGKHNDLDDVGKDVYHHTFFEMLGSWSFGDYFKEGAIRMAWDLLVNKWGLDPARLYVTYFAGTDEVPADNEARDIWLNIDKRLPASHVLPYGMKENFWEMGESGPCGPCSEIHYDRLNINRDASALVNADDPDVLEIWNLVFIQYNRLPSDKSLVLLPAKHIDTGMGFERIVSVLQDKPSNYDTDVFVPYFDKIFELSSGKIERYGGRVPNTNNEDSKCAVDVAYRVVADHIRTLSVAISDGCRPDNVGRGYVLRRILRRAIRFSSEHLMLGVGQLSELVDVADKSLSVFYPEISKNNGLIKKIINEEEMQFLNTLRRGKMVLDRCIENNYKDEKKFKFDSAVAWKLYDTFGFPVDLTQIMVEERGGYIDMAEFEQHKNETINKNKSKVENVNVSERFESSEVDFGDIPPTDDSLKYDLLGEHENAELTLKVLKIFQKPNSNVIGVVFDRTNFYAEEGGQESDSGVVVNTQTNSIFSVVDVQKVGNHVVHIVRLEGTNITPNETFFPVVNVERRKKLMANHTATHLLNFALRSTFNQDVYSIEGHTNNNNLTNLVDADQKGSLVAEDRLRFDFKYNEAMTKEQLELTEATVNSMIEKNYAVNSFDLPLAQAKSVPGLRAMFEEHYPDPVRVVAIGADQSCVLDNKTSAFNFSIELCGGTHVKTTKEINKFVIVSESAIARGIRRIVAVTGEQAESCLSNYSVLNENFEKFLVNIESENALTSIKQKNELSAEILNFMNETNTVNLPYTKKSFFTEQLRKIKQKLDEFERQCVKQASNKFTASLKDKLNKKDKEKFVIVEVTDSDAALLATKSIDACVKKLNVTDCVVAVLTKDELNDKTATYINVPKELTEHDAKDILTKVYEACELSVKFGGKKDCAQGTVPSTSSYDKILNTLIEKLKI